MRYKWFDNGYNVVICCVLLADEGCEHPPHEANLTCECECVACIVFYRLNEGTASPCLESGEVSIAHHSTWNIHRTQDVELQD